MDISEFDTQTNSENGMWFQPTIYGRRMPLELCIVGNDSDEVIKFNRKQLKKLNVSTKDLAKEDVELDEDTLDELTEINKESIARRVIDIRAVDKKGNPVDEPIILNGKEITKSIDDIIYLLESVPELRKFILDKSGDRENFLSDRKKN